MLSIYYTVHIIIAALLKLCEVGSSVNNRDKTVLLRTTGQIVYSLYIQQD